MHRVLRGLPPIFLDWLPELLAYEWPVQSGRHCKLLSESTPSDPDDTSLYRSAVCCSFHPFIPSFYLGEVLLAGGTGAQQVRARLQASEAGVGPQGITSHWNSSSATDSKETRRVCPYWSATDSGCSLGNHRAARCRTWSCDGVGRSAGHSLATTMRTALEQSERLLTEDCIDAGQPPEPGATPAQWEQWYLWCAGHARGRKASPSAPLSLASPRAALQSAYAELHRWMPPILTPSAPPFRVEGTSVVFCTSNPFDQQRYPKTVFSFLSLLDGQRSWLSALRQANASEEVSLSSEDVVDLFRAQILSPTPEAGEPNAEWMDTGKAIQMSPTRPGWNAIVPDTSLLSVQPRIHQRLDDGAVIKEGPGFLYLEVDLPETLVEDLHAMIRAKRVDGAFQRREGEHGSDTSRHCARTSVETSGIAAVVLDSDYGIDRWQDERMEDLFERIRHYASLLTHTTTEQQVAFGPVVAWSHITQSGGFMTYHDHGGSWDQPLSILSAVFYIATGDSTSPDIGGSVSLLDRSLKREIRSYPHPGLLIIFPDYVAHGVHTYHGSHDRIIIGVNVEPVPSQD